MRVFLQLPASQLAATPDILPFLNSSCLSPPPLLGKTSRKAAMVLPEPMERNGFRVTTKVFTSPPDPASLDPVTKRTITISNLFVNHRLPIADIVRILDEEYKHVVAVLIEQGFVYDRRGRSRAVTQAEPERSLFRKRPPQS